MKDLIMLALLGGAAWWLLQPKTSAAMQIDPVNQTPGQSSVPLLRRRSKMAFGGGIPSGAWDPRNTPDLSATGYGSVKCVWISGGPNGGGTVACGEVRLHAGFHQPLQQ